MATLVIEPSSMTCRFRVLALVTVALFSCATPSPTKAVATPSPFVCDSKIRRYDEMPTAERDAFISKNSYQLVMGDRLFFYGANHSRDSEHPQVSAIQQAWEKFAPQHGIFEGQEEAFESTAKETVKRHGEPGLVRFLAAQAGTSSGTGEPSSAQKIAYLKTIFEPRKVELFYYMRTAAQLRDRQGFDRAKIFEFMERQFVPLLRERQVKFEILELNSVQKEYRKYWKAPKNWWEAPEEWFGPAKSGEETGGIFTNSIHAEESHYRNLYLFRAISQQVTQGKRVFVLFGMHHIPVLEPAIRCLLGNEEGFHQ